MKMIDLSAEILRRISTDVTTFSDGREIPEGILDSFIEFVYRELVVLETTSQLTPSQCEALRIVEFHSRTANIS